MPSTRVLLVHGAHMGAWCWLPVIERLGRVGVPAEAIDLPFTGFDDDVAAVAGRMAELAERGPVVAVAHSYSGPVVAAASTSASASAKVTRLVFVAAALPRDSDSGSGGGDGNESPAAIIPTRSDALRDAMVSGPDGVIRLDPSGRDALFSGSPANLADFAMAHVRPMRRTDPAEPIPDPAWRRLPSLYVVCRDDRAVRVEAQRAWASTLSESVELDCDHSPFFSAPDQLAQLIAGQVRR